MKRIVCFLIVLITLLCVVSCDKTYETVETVETAKTVEPLDEQEHNRNIEIWTDKETGVQYIIYDRTSRNCGMGGITPRYNADGTLYVVEVTENE